MINNFMMRHFTLIAIRKKSKLKQPQDLISTCQKWKRYHR